MLLVSLVLVSGYLLLRFSDINLIFSDVVILVLAFSAITLITLYIFFRGRKKDPGSRTMHIFVALSIKMLMEMILALGWFFIAKKNSAPSVILFFVLYLGFTLSSIFYILNTLNNKSL